MRFNDLYASDNCDLYEVAMTVIAIEKFFEPDITDSELCDLDLGEPKFAYYESKKCGFATVVQTSDDVDEYDPIYYHLCCVYHNDRIYAIMTHCAEDAMFEIDPVTWVAREYHPTK